MTPREAEFPNLREFWKQYIRVPLTGPSSISMSFPLTTPTPNNDHGQLEAPPGTTMFLVKVATNNLPLSTTAGTVALSHGSRRPPELRTSRFGLEDYH